MTRAESFDSKEKCEDYLSNYYLNLNLSSRTKTFPTLWEHAEVIPIYKGESKFNCI